jgi:hypothetical protein
MKLVLHQNHPYFLLILLLIGIARTPAAFGSERPRFIPRERVLIQAQLNAPTLQNFLNTIELPDIASALKISYFGGRARSASLPVAEGLSLPKVTLAKEPVASKRWFWLQNVRGWAAFRCKEISPDEGFAAYTELFDQADKAKAAKEVYAPQLALIEWVSTVSGRLSYLHGEDGRRLRDDERTAGVLLKAWSAYASLLRQTSGHWNGREPDWSRAIQETGASDEFIAAVEKTLNDAAVPKTVYLLTGAAAVLRATKPERALELFASAQPLLPKDATGKIEPRSAGTFFDNWIELLREQKKNAEAKAVARERVATLNNGYSELLKLQFESKDEAGIAATLADLAKPDAPEYEIVSVARVLNNRWDKDRQNQQLAKQSETLLTGYLQSARPRSLAAELEARYRLGWLLLEQKQIGKAKAALDLSALHFDENLLDSQSRLLLQNIRAMQAKRARL